MNGVPGLPPSLVHWASLSFRPEKLRRMVFEYSTLGERPRLAATAHRTIVRDDALVSLLAERLQEGHLQTSFVIMTELIVKQYVRDILQLVILPRAMKDRSHEKREVRERSERIVDKLSDLDAYDLDGFSPRSLSMLLEFRPHAVPAMAPNAQGRTRNGAVPHFPDYNGKGWHDWPGKLQGLFQWGDDRDEKKPRGWDHYPFRRLVRRFYGLVFQHRGAEVAAGFRERLGHNAAEYLWMIPSYDHDHIAVMHKPSSHHKGETRREIQCRSQLEKTKWLAACFKPDSISAQSLEAVNQHFREPTEEARYRLSSERLEIGQGRIRQALKRGLVMVWESSVGTGPQWLSAGLLHAPWYGMDLHLTQAEEIALQVERRAEAVVDDDASSKDSEGSPVAPFNDGEGRGFLFDGRGTSNQEPDEDEDAVGVDMSPLRHREPAQPAWPVRPVRIEVVIPSRGFPFDRNDDDDISDQEPGEGEDSITVDSSSLRRREPTESTSPVRPMTIEVVIPSKRSSRKRQASVSPERQARRSLRGQPIFTEAT